MRHLFRKPAFLTQKSWKAGKGITGNNFLNCWVIFSTVPILMIIMTMVERSFTGASVHHMYSPWKQLFVSFSDSNWRPGQRSTRKKQVVLVPAMAAYLLWTPFDPWTLVKVPFNNYLWGNVNPGWINHGLWQLGGTLQIVTIWYIHGTLPIKQPFGVY